MNAQELRDSGRTTLSASIHHSRLGLTLLVCPVLLGAIHPKSQAQTPPPVCLSEEFTNLEVDQPSAGFGQCISLDGNTALIGQFPGPSDLPRGRIMERVGGEWVLRADLMPDPPLENNGLYGWSCALKGSLAVVGDMAYPYPVGGLFKGSVHVFNKVGQEWSYVDMLVSSDFDNPDYGAFGRHIAIANDRIVVSADSSTGTSGSVYIFEHDGDTWVETSKISMGNWPYVFNLAADGDVIAVGLNGYPNQFHTGAAVFRKVGSEWIQEAMWVDMGHGIDVDGDRLVLAGDETDDTPVSLFQYDGDSWVVEQELTAPELPECVFEGMPLLNGEVALRGDFLALSCDGGFEVEGQQYAGLVLVLRHDGVEFGAEAVLVHPDTHWCEGDGCEGYHFGTQFALGEDVILGNLTVYPAWGPPAFAVAAYHGISDCDGNGVLDLCQLQEGSLEDMNGDGTADVCQCLGDLNGDGIVSAHDIVQLVHAFGPCDGCPEDLNGDGVVNPLDLRILLDNLGMCGEAPFGFGLQGHAHDAAESVLADR